VRLTISGVSKRFGATLANDNISLSLAKGEVLALLGENGAGKTTLMNILFGHYVSDTGTIEIDETPLPPGQPQEAIKAGLGMVHQHFTLAENLSVLDNITLGTEPLFQLWRNKAKARKKLDSLADQFGLAVSADAMVSELSVGEKQRVEILKALYRDAQILILDEPTAVLTPNEAEQLFKMLGKMVGRGLSLIFISHKLHEILAISDRVAVLRHGQIVGEVATAIADKAMLAKMMIGREVTRPNMERQTPGEVILDIRQVSHRAIPGSAALSEISLQVRKREIVGIAGVAGNGQFGLASMLSGRFLPDRGQITLFGDTLKSTSPRALVNAGVARIPEDRATEGVIGEMMIWENLLGEHLRNKARAGVLINHQAALAEARSLIKQYDVRCEGPQAQTGLLSGGNIQKLILARSLSTLPNFILANQPVRGLDEGAIAYVQSQILAARKRGAGILLISEDLDELFEISDRIAVLFHGTLRGPFDINDISIAQVGLMMSGEAYSPASTQDNPQAQA
jgi:ABC-type uncharacterized transport system ATPase subunit